MPAADAPYDAPNAGVATAAERDAAALGRGVFSAFGALREIDAAMLDAHGFGLGDAVIGAGDTEIGGFLIRGLGAEGSGSGLDRDASSDPVPAEGR